MGRKALVLLIISLWVTPNGQNPKQRKQRAIRYQPPVKARPSPSTEGEYLQTNLNELTLQLCV